MAISVIARRAAANSNVARAVIARLPAWRVASVPGAFLAGSVADDFPDPWGFSDCEDVAAVRACYDAALAAHFDSVIVRLG